MKTDLWKAKQKVKAVILQWDEDRSSFQVPPSNRQRYQRLLPCCGGERKRFFPNQRSGTRFQRFSQCDLIPVTAASPHYQEVTQISDKTPRAPDKEPL
ncbi:hypothetical protein EYF80_020644 [Liparis tanakae]|uniref:Uncharacterized protein n=1 Tax=Liparis tanakae TaxID=230148 RepID=A0A4Z2HU21_9TELE|nr:hypothetical protein EYF80_020644 [Liparis tanakae]